MTISSFQGAAGTAIFPLAQHISTQEARALELTCKTIRVNMIDVRGRVTHAHLSSPQTDDEKLAVKIGNLARFFPALTSLELNITNLSAAGLEILATAPQLPKITQLTLYGDARKMEFREGLDAMTHLVKRIDCSQLEVFHVGRAESIPSLPTKLLLEMLTRCKVLKVFCLYEMSSLLSSPRGFFALLPGTLEEFGPFMTGSRGEVSHRFTNTVFIEQFMAKCADPTRLKKCDVSFVMKKPSSIIGIDPRKLDSLLNFLPLSKMSHVRLEGGMDAQHLDAIGSQLQLNSNLITLRIIGTKAGLPAILALLKSIRSFQLKELEIDDVSLKLHINGTPRALLQKLAAKIRQLDQDNLTASLSNITEGSQEDASQ